MAREGIACYFDFFNDERPHKALGYQTPGELLRWTAWRGSLKMIGGKMIGHRPISTSQHHPGAQRRQLRTGAIEAEQGQRGHGGRKPGKGMNLATSPQNECENPQETRLAAWPIPQVPRFLHYSGGPAKGRLRSGAPTEGADKEASHLFLRVRSRDPSRGAPDRNVGQ